MDCRLFIQVHTFRNIMKEVEFIINRVLLFKYYNVHFTSERKHFIYSNSVANNCRFCLMIAWQFLSLRFKPRKWMKL